MKSKINILLLIFFSSLFLQNCNFNDPVGIQKENKLHTITKWHVSDNNLKIRKVSFKEFDLLGNIIRQEEFAENGFLKSLSTFTYDTGLTKEEHSEFNSGTTIEIQITSYKLDDKGNITEKTYYNNNGDTISILRFSYDAKGNILEKFEFDKKGDILNRTNYSYNYNNIGLVTGSAIKTGNDAVFMSRDSIIYKTSENIVERIIFSSSGEVDHKQILNYNDNGRVVNESNFSKSGNLINKFLFEYTFYNN